MIFFTAQVGVDSKTITNWLSVLQASYLVTLLPPYFENISKRLVKSPKLYFCDPGLACFLLDIESPRQLERDKMRGAIFENYIVMEVIKHRFNRGLLDGVFFYRDSNQNEVDILLKEEGEITAIEVKSSMTYHSSFADSITKLSNFLFCKHVLFVNYGLLFLLLGNRIPKSPPKVQHLKLMRVACTPHFTHLSVKF